MKFFLTALAAFASLGLVADAQFHSQKGGQTAVNPQAVEAARQQTSSMMSTQGGAAQVGTNANSTIYVSEAHKQNYGARLGEQDSKMIHVWGRAIHHTDGSYTESKQDETTNTLEQITKSENGVKLQRRMVMLDDMGRPTEVMIYDGREQFKYRGVQIYDRLGRFQEEQLFDSKGTLIRRKVQEYDPQGRKLPVRSWDYVANVPEDLKLVITRESEAEDAANQPPRETPVLEGATERRKGGALGKLFGGKKAEGN